MEKIREFFWPLLENSTQEVVPNFVHDDLQIHDDNVQKVLEYTMKIYDYEMSRNSTIESKASLFIGTIAIITSVVLAITSTLINQNEYNSIFGVLLFLLFVLTVYVLRTVWFAIKVHERKAFHTFYLADVLQNGSQLEYSRSLIIKLVNHIKKNSLIINSKINNMVMAQEYFKRAISTLGVYSFLLIIYFLEKWHGNISESFKICLDTINKTASKRILVITLTILIFINLLTYYRLRKSLKNNVA